jgi:hypothetical protein
MASPPVDSDKYKTLTDHFVRQHSKQKVVPSDPRVRKAEEGVLQVMTSILDGVAARDRKFASKLIKSGSYYDGVKVGQPDEFDFMAELSELSRPGACEFRTTKDAGFVYMIPQRKRSRWTDFCVQLCQHDRRDCPECVNKKKLPKKFEIIAPDKIQARFRTLVDQVVSDPGFPLPDGWEHGGYNRPYFSLGKIHGPAVLVHFVISNYKKGKELKLTLDISLCVRIPQPIDVEAFGFVPLQTLPPDHPTYKRIKEGVMSDEKAGLHVIPLYSKLMIRTER